MWCWDSMCLQKRQPDCQCWRGMWGGACGNHGSHRTCQAWDRSTPSCKGSSHWTTQRVLFSGHFAPRHFYRAGLFVTYSSTRTGLEFTGLIKGLKRGRTPPTCVTVVDMVRVWHSKLDLRNLEKTWGQPGRADHVMLYTVFGMMSRSFLLLSHLLHMFDLMIDSPSVHTLVVGWSRSGYCSMQVYI